MTEKSVRSAAKELNKVLGLEPALDVKAKLPALTKEIKECIEEEGVITDEDEFTDATQAVLDEIGGEAEEDEDDAPVKKSKGKKKPAPEPEEDDDDEDDDEENDEDDEEDVDEDDDEDSLADQIEEASKVSELKAIVKENDEFKPLRKKLASHKNTKALKKAMLSLIEDDDEDEDDAPVKKDKKKASPFKSTKETLGTTRMIEVAKAMGNIKKSKDIDTIAEAANNAFVKAGGASNVKQSKNIIKVLLPAAEKWGIVVNKDGKLLNP